MGKRRKPDEAHGVSGDQVPKKQKLDDRQDKRKKNDGLIFEPRPDWHAAELPYIAPKDITQPPSQRTIESLHKYGKSLLEAENAAYNASHMSGSSSHKFLSTIMSSGTLEDKVSALTLLVQESPLHTMKAFENLLGLSKKKSRNQALMALAALKDLLAQGVVLPADRKLYAFGKQPMLLAALQGKSQIWNEGDQLPGGLQKIHLLFWAYEDWLKKSYFEILHSLESWLGDEVEYSRGRAVTYVWELLKDKPEQEENLLRLLVNKLGDTAKKIASRASYLLLQLETTHPAMKTIITNSIEADCLFRPGQSQHAKYYATITLNQTMIGPKEQELASKLLKIYFTLFLQLWKPVEQNVKVNKHNKIQGGGGKPGKLAMKKQKETERHQESEEQLRDKMIAQVLTGVNRAFPFVDTQDATFEKELDTIFRVTHSANFNTAIQALMLIQQISSTTHYGAERFYRTLYESLLDPRLLTSSKQIMYLNLLYKSLKQDLNPKRVAAFVKRMSQIITVHDPSFVCGILYLIAELEKTFPSIRSMINESQDEEEDGEEHFVDAPEDGAYPVASNPDVQTISKNQYDPRKRDPEHAHADRSCLWDLLPFLQHYHPSVSLFAEGLIHNNSMPPKPDPTHHTLMHFLDRFVYRSPRTKNTVATRGSSIMQPTAGSNTASLLFRPGKDGTTKLGAELNNADFWQKKVEDVAADEVFFHSYFNQAGFQKRKGAGKKKAKSAEEFDGSEGEEDAGEDEIWKAITASKPEVDGDAEDDDDVSLGDLQEAYSDADSGSEAGIDLGGEDRDGADGEEGLLLDDGGQDDDDLDDDALNFESGEEDAMFDSEDDVPDVNVPQEPMDEKELSKSQLKRRERKKLKQLPVFASAEDYAKLLGVGGDDDGDEYM